MKKTIKKTVKKASKKVTPPKTRTQMDIDKEIKKDGEIQQYTKKTLEKKRKDIQTFEMLIEYLRDIKDNGRYQSYGGVVSAMGQALLAVAFFFAREFGITGFQASCLMWEFLREWSFPNNKSGLRIIDLDLLLFPQYDDRYKKFLIDSAQKRVLIQAAKDKMADCTKYDCSPAVWQRWKDMSKGKFPSFVTIEEDTNW